MLFNLNKNLGWMKMLQKNKKMPFYNKIKIINSKMNYNNSCSSNSNNNNKKKMMMNLITLNNSTNLITLLKVIKNTS